MSSISDDQKQLLFDYAFGLTSDSESAEAQDLVSWNEEAERIYGRLRSVLAPLDTFEVEQCPDELAERTVSKLTELAGSARQNLGDLLAEEQTLVSRGSSYLRARNALSGAGRQDSALAASSLHGDIRIRRISRR